MMQMTLIKWIVLFLSASANGRFLNLGIPDGVSVGERLMKKIFESCYGNNNLSNSIVIFGNFNGFIEHAPIIRMNSLMEVNETYGKGQLLTIRATQFALIEDSPEKLQSDLKLLMKTGWWNHMASFFIIGSRRTACKNVKDILMTTWRMNMINSIYICPENTNTAILYTLNLMADYAPYPWRRMRALTDLNVYFQYFHSSISCQNLNYDKTEFLNGYVIRVVLPAYDARFKISGNSRHLKIVRSMLDRKTDVSEHEVFHSLMNQLNATIKYDSMITSNEDSLENHLDSYNSDIIYGGFPPYHFPNQSLLYPHAWITLLALAKPHETPTLTKIVHLWSSQVLLLGFISLTILSSILVMKNHGLSSAMLDVIRFLVYTSIRSNTRGLSFRIYFIPMLIFIVISNGVFQGRIASFLTKSDKDELVATLEQLIHLKYEFSVSKPCAGIVKRLHPEIEFATVTIGQCITWALERHYRACITSNALLLERQDFLSLENVRGIIMTQQVNFVCRNNWPLYDRVNGVMMRYMESGMYQYWARNKTYYVTHRREADKFALMMENIRPVYRPVKLRKLDFAFKLLVTGFLLATIIFVLELGQLMTIVLLAIIIFVVKLRVEVDD